jgi:hypothetical protein
MTDVVMSGIFTSATAGLPKCTHNFDGCTQHPDGGVPKMLLNAKGITLGLSTFRKATGEHGEQAPAC